MVEAISLGVVPEISKPSSFTKRVEAKPSELVCEEYLMFPDVYGCGWKEELDLDEKIVPGNRVVEVEQQLEEEVERYIKDLKYKPFDAQMELKNIRFVSKKENNLTKTESKRLRKNRMAELRENLNYQTLGIAKTLQDLYQTIQTNPDAAEDELIQKVLDSAVDYRYNKTQLFLFLYGIRRYLQDHRIIEDYWSNYSPEDLFKQCFGNAPKGSIQALKTPLSIHFCMGIDDYTLAYNVGKKAQNEEEAAKQRQDALFTGGAKLPYVKNKSLNGLVTIENGLWKRKKMIKEEEKRTNHLEEKLFIYLPNCGNEILFVCPEGKEYSLNFVERGEFNSPSRFTLTEKGVEEPLFDYALDDKSKNRQFKNILGGNVEKSWFLKENGKNQILISLSPDFLQVIKCDEAGNVAVEYGEIIDRETGEYEEDRIFVHELQHIFNGLLTPVEWDTLSSKVFYNALRKSDNPQEVKERLLIDLIKFSRKKAGIDWRARDEILAYYKDGRKQEDILKILKEDPLYDYKNQLKGRLERSFLDIIGLVKEKMSLLSFETSEDGNVSLVNAVPFEITRQELQPYINRAFVEEYQRDLETWINCTSKLEEKGYTKEEVMAILYQEPVKSWKDHVKRLPEKTA